MAEEKHWEEGMKTHENVIFSCYGGMSNTGIVSGLACLEAVKELGLEKAAIMCLGGLPTKSIVLTRDIGMKKKGLSEDIGGDIKGVMDYISDDEVKRAKELIVSTILEE